VVVGAKPVAVGVMALSFCVVASASELLFQKRSAGSVELRMTTVGEYSRLG